MRESTIMLLHYFTGLGILIAGGVHLATLFLTAPVEQNLQFYGISFAVLSIYRNPLLAGSLEVLLITVTFHAFNGLRVILLELYQGDTWSKVVNWLLIFLALVVMVYGTRTVLIANSIVPA